MDLLDAHPHIRCEGEVFKAGASAPLRFAGERAALARLRGADAWGCKILDQQLKWYEPGFGGISAFLDRAVDDGWALVHLTRRDLLAQALSGLHADRSQHHFRTGDSASFAPMEVDPVDLITWMRMAEDNASWLAESVAPFHPLHLEYERDLTTQVCQQRAVDEVCELLEIDPAPVASELVRISPASVRDRVANWDEVASVVAATRYRTFLEGVGDDVEAGPGG